MIESLFKELLPSPNDKNDGREKIKDLSAPNDSFLAALPVVEKIVRRRLAFSNHSDAPDLTQSIFLRLWKWREKYQEKSERLSPGEWEAFAARAAYNEINRYFSRRISPANVPLEAASTIADAQTLECESEIEVQSIIRLVWQEICRMSLRQRRALLLHNEEIIVYFLKDGIADTELAAALEFTKNQWLDVKVTLPLSDKQIAHLFEERIKDARNLESASKSIKKARREARVKLQKITK